MEEFWVLEEGCPLGRGDLALEWTSLMIISCLGIREATQKYIKRAAKLESEILSLLLIGGGILGKSLTFY